MYYRLQVSLSKGSRIRFGSKVDKKPTKVMRVVVLKMVVLVVKEQVTLDVDQLKLRESRILITLESMKML